MHVYYISQSDVIADPTSAMWSASVPGGQSSVQYVCYPDPP